MKWNNLDTLYLLDGAVHPYIFTNGKNIWVIDPNSNISPWYSNKVKFNSIGDTDASISTATHWIFLHDLLLLEKQKEQ